MSGARLVYVEIPAPDVDAATRFYREVFAWQIDPSDLSDQPYAMFVAGEGDQGFMGGLRSDLPVASGGGPILYLAVDAIPAALASIEAAGGRTIREKEPIGGEYGFSAEFADPAGNVLGLWSET